MVRPLVPSAWHHQRHALPSRLHKLASRPIFYQLYSLQPPSSLPHPNPQSSIVTEMDPKSILIRPTDHSTDPTPSTEPLSPPCTILQPQQQQQQQQQQPSTLAIHASSSHLHPDSPSSNHPIAPPIQVSTNYAYPSHPSLLTPLSDTAACAPHAPYIYSRLSQPTASALELTLSTLLHGPCVTYASGCAAYHALLTAVNPRRVAIGRAYHGCLGNAWLHARLTGAQLLGLECEEGGERGLREGDLLHLETPANPTGEAVSIRALAAKARRCGALLVVDSTFGPPPLQDPLGLGADFVLTSGSKYLGGHSDLLMGVLTMRDDERGEEWARVLREQRLLLGSMMGSLESWLGVRSVKTLELRVVRQSANAGEVVRWLHAAVGGQGAQEKGEDGDEAVRVIRAVVARVHHSSVQDDQGEWVREQMPNGGSPTFSIIMRSEDMAKTLPSKLQLFAHATSLGAVESLVEWRAMSDDSVDRSLLRLSIGVEHVDDLKADLLQGFQALARDFS